MRRVLTLGLLAALAGCGGSKPAPRAEPPAGFARYDRAGISFDRPAAWTHDEPTPGLTEFYGTPGQGGLPPQVAVAGETARNDLDDVVTLHKDMQKIRYPSYRVTEDRAVSVAGAAGAHKVDAEYQIHKPGERADPAARGQPAGPDRGRAPTRLLRALARRRLCRREARRDLRLLPPAVTRAFWLGLLVATVTFLVLLFIAARVIDSSTDTVDASNKSWLFSCAIAGLIAGFLGDRVARAAPALAVRYTAAILGPALLALLFALTTDPAEPAGPWFALAISIAAARSAPPPASSLAGAQRRR